MESEDSENSSASENKMETQQIFSSKSRIDRSRMRTRVGISPPVPFKYGYSFTRQKRTIIYGKQNWTSVKYEEPITLMIKVATVSSI